MVNYPYQTNFVNPLPAWPVHVACDNVTSTTPKVPMDYVKALQSGANVFYNSYSQLKCLNLTGSTSGGLD